MSAPAYAEFGVQSNFSFLRAASRPEELVLTAHLLGYAGLGLADRNTVAGTVRAWSQSKEIPQEKEPPASLPYHPGARLVFSCGMPDILAYPRNRTGWGNLCRMLTQANARGGKGNPDLRREDFFEWGGDMSLAALPRLDDPAAAGLPLLEEIRDRFGRAMRIGVAPLHGGNDLYRIELAASLAGKLGSPLMATTDALYHSPGRRDLQDVMTAIRLKTTVAAAGYALQANSERWLKPREEIARLFRSHPEAIAETLRFASELSFSFDELKWNYPDEPTRDGATAQQELERLTWEGAEMRFPDGVPKAIRETIARELSLVGELKYAGYFLTVHEIVQFAKREGILCQGRGSAANSLICFCLFITDVHPERLGSQLFERFVSAERGEPPDIDVDFEHQRREEVIQFIYAKYNRRRTALAAAVISYRGRSALREVGKAMGLSEDAVGALSGSVWQWSGELGDEQTKAAGLKGEDRLTAHVIRLANEIQGAPRHLSQHVGGFVITRDRLDEIVPIVKTAMDDREMIEWDKDDLDAVGLFKVDILALGMLSCLQRAFGLLASHHGLPLTIDGIFARQDEEPPVYAMIQRADTLGVFQIESRAQMSMLPRLKPKEFYDLVIEVAIVRPGPIQGQMVHPYLRRREGKEQPEYPKEELKKILRKTLGVPLFQEQAMRIAIVAGGFSPDKADRLRRAMATFKRSGTIGRVRGEMIEGMVRNGYERDFAERCFKQIEGFGEYGFPESHAASFALLVYVSCWFKAYYPDIFCAAMLNSQPMGFYAPAQLVRDAQEHGVDIRPVDVNHSGWDCTLEDQPFDITRIAPRHASMSGTIRSRHAVRLGFRQVKGLAEADLEQLVLRRGNGYASVRDVWLRSGLPITAIRRLAQADAFRSIGLDRRNALWAVRALGTASAADRMPLLDDPAKQLRDGEPQMVLPEMPLGEHVIHDYRTLSLSLKAHPVSFLRRHLDEAGVLPNAGLTGIRGGRRVSVSGLVLVRQRPGSAQGVIFMTIEDESASANIIVWKKVFARFRSIILGARFVRVSGRLQSQSGVIHVVAESIEDLSPWLSDLSELNLHREALAHADEIRRPFPGSWRDKRSQRKASPTHEQEEQAAIQRRTAAAMPKGRNFQ